MFAKYLTLYYVCDDTRILFVEDDILYNDNKKSRYFGSKPCTHLYNVKKQYTEVVCTTEDNIEYRIKNEEKELPGNIIVATEIPFDSTTDQTKNFIYDPNNPDKIYEAKLKNGIIMKFTFSEKSYEELKNVALANFKSLANRINVFKI